MLQDIRFALRVYGKSPGFAALAILSLALGVGANTSLFSVMNYLLLKPMPVPQPQRVVVLSRGARTEFSFPDYRNFLNRSRSFSGLAASNPTESSLDLEGDAAAAGLEAVSGNYAATLGLKASVGRWFTDENEPVAVLSHGVWKTRFRSDPSVVGRVIRSEKRYWTVIGVATPEFTGTYAPLSMTLWVPLRQWVSQYANVQASLEDSTQHRWMLFGRLRDGVSPSEATAELNAIDLSAMREANRDTSARETLLARVAQGIGPAHFRRGAVPMSALLLAIGVGVLLIACLNVANLLLAKGAARRGEIGVRMSLGAGRHRVISQLLTEALVLVIIGSLAGLLFGHWTNRLLQTMFTAMPFGESILLDLAFDYRVFAYAGVVSLLTTLVCGLAPAFRASRVDPIAVIRGGRGGHQKTQRAVLVGQVALSLALLSCAGMFLHTWLRLQQADTGFTIENRMVAQVFVSEPEFTPESAQRFYFDSVDRLRAAPGVVSAALTELLPLQGRSFDCVAVREGEVMRVPSSRVGDGFLGVMNIPLEQGRDFSLANRGASSRVLIVNQTLARRFWPHAPAVGQSLKLGCKNPVIAEVIGVARDSKIHSISEEPQPLVYQPFGPTASGLMTIVMAVSAQPALVSKDVRGLLAKPGVRVYSVNPLAQHVEQSYWAIRWESSTLAIFGGLSMLLAAVGLYGAMVHYVTQRTRELGIRMALGAGLPNMIGLVARQGLRLTAAGIVIGSLLAIGAGSLLRSMLFGVGLVDWPSLAAAALLWVLVAALACIIPALRVTRISPLNALRYE